MQEIRTKSDGFNIDAVDLFGATIRLTTPSNHG